MKKPAIKLTKKQKIDFMKKHSHLNNEKLIKLIRRKFHYSEKTYDKDILYSFKRAYTCQQ